MSRHDMFKFADKISFQKQCIKGLADPRCRVCGQLLNEHGRCSAQWESASPAPPDRHPILRGRQRWTLVRFKDAELVETYGEYGVTLTFRIDDRMIVFEVGDNDSKGEMLRLKKTAQELCHAASK